MHSRVVPALLLVTMLVASASWARKPHQRLSDEERGEMLYERHCVSCHGATAAGDGPATAALVVPVPDLRGQVTADRRDAQAEVVLQGRGAMPGFTASFDKYDARRVLRHMQQLEETPSEDAPDEP